jgi:hypothetical protein
MTLSSQTVTPLLPFFSFSEQCKAALVKEMVGKKLNELRTPTLVIDRKIVQRNCEKLGKASSDLGIKVRVHVKTHKVFFFFYYYYLMYGRLKKKIYSDHRRC